LFNLSSVADVDKFGMLAESAVMDICIDNNYLLTGVSDDFSPLVIETLEVELDLFKR
jgi:hypothetical protein